MIELLILSIRGRNFDASGSTRAEKIAGREFK